MTDHTIRINTATHHPTITNYDVHNRISGDLDTNINSDSNSNSNKQPLKSTAATVQRKEMTEFSPNQLNRISDGSKEEFVRFCKTLSMIEKKRVDIRNKIQVIS